VSNTSATLQGVGSVDDFLNAAATETVSLFEHLDFEFLLEYDVFAPASGLLDSTYAINSTHVEALQYNATASWDYDPTVEEYYYGFGCTLVSTGAKIPIAAEFAWLLHNSAKHVDDKAVN